MADEAAVITSTPTQQPTVVNGFDRLAAATATAPATEMAPPASTAPLAAPADAPAAPTVDRPADPDRSAPTTDDHPTAARSAAAADSAADAGEEVAPYSRQPYLLTEHALLGSLLHAPTVLDEVEGFLGARDFATAQTRAVYATLRGLHRSGALFDVAAMPTQAQRLHAANENHLRLFTALRTRPPQYTTTTIGNVPGLLTRLVAAAPPESLPLWGVYDPSAQLRLARMVLETSCRRQLHTMGVLMRQATPRSTPVTSAPHQAEHLASNLTTIQGQLQTMTDRLLRAIHRTNPNAAPTVGVPAGQDQNLSTTPGRWTMPDPLRTLSTPLRHRAERHILHLALHAGRMRDIPAEILNLTPEDFTTAGHANLWRTIKDLHAQGLPANYVAVFLQTRADGFAHHPMPSDRALLRMAQPPDVKPDRVARSLHTITAAALVRASKQTHRTITALAADTTTPVQTVLAQASQAVDALAARATTATQPAQSHGRHHRP